MPSRRKKALEELKNKKEYHNKSIHLTGIPAGDGRRYGQKKKKGKINWA